MLSVCCMHCHPIGSHIHNNVHIILSVARLLKCLLVFLLLLVSSASQPMCESNCKLKECMFNNTNYRYIVNATRSLWQSTTVSRPNFYRVFRFSCGIIEIEIHFMAFHQIHIDTHRPGWHFIFVFFNFELERFEVLVSYVCLIHMNR